MPDRWMEERERRWRERNWRSEAYGRGDERQGRLWGEDRSWSGSADDERGPGGARFQGQGRDRVFGEADTGAQYNIRTPRPGGGAYGAGGSYGGGEGYGRDAGRMEPGRGREGRPAWQDRGYQGDSPAMYRGGGYEADRSRGQPRFEPQDYTQGGRFYGDDRRMPIYREEYAQGRTDYGPAPRGYDAEQGRGPGWSGGTGGYDYERGYGDGGRMEGRGQQGRDHGRGGWQDRDYQGESPAMYRGGGYEAERERGGWGDRGRDRYEDRGREGPGFEGHARAAGDFLQRAGQRLSAWFGEMSGERRDDGRRDERDDGPRRYSADFGREERWVVDRGHQGRGPKNYDRPDERISDEAHQRLTDDRWLDASNVSVSVSGGEITLSGTVENREAKHRAERLVEDISGVKHVQNNLRIDRGNVLTGSGSGFGDSVAEAKMRNEGASDGEDSAATRTTTRRT